VKKQLDMWSGFCWNWGGGKVVKGKIDGKLGGKQPILCKHLCSLLKFTLRGKGIKERELKKVPNSIPVKRKALGILS